MITTDDIRRLATALPKVEEFTHARFGVPGFKVLGSSFVGMDKGEATAVFSIAPEDAATAVAGDPATYEEVWRTAGRTIFVGLRVDLAKVSEPRVRELVEQAWRNKAPRRVLAVHDARVPAAGTLSVVRGTAADAPALLGLFDDAVAWLVARGQTGQWGSEPFSALPARVARVHEWAGGGGLWFARSPRGEPAGALVVGAAHDYVPPAATPELYVQVLLTAAAWRGRGVGATLIAHAEDLARREGAQQLRVDCWAGVRELPAAYERLGFVRSGSFDAGGWPGAILVRPTA